VPCHSARYAVEVGRPATARLEFMCRLIERGVACSAGVNTLFGHVLVIFAGEWRFSALFSQDSKLFCWMC